MQHIPEANDVLIVEDDPTRQLICKLAAKKAWASAPRAVSNFKDFCEQVVSQKPKVCLLDGNFPRDKDDPVDYLGEEALTVLFDQGQVNPASVVIVSSDEKMRTKGREAGCIVVDAESPTEFSNQVTLHVKRLLETRTF